MFLDNIKVFTCSDRHCTSFLQIKAIDRIELNDQNLEIIEIFPFSLLFIVEEQHWRFVDFYRRLRSHTIQLQF